MSSLVSRLQGDVMLMLVERAMTTQSSNKTLVPTIATFQLPTMVAFDLFAKNGPKFF